jgi:hypothetical protein
VSAGVGVGVGAGGVCDVMVELLEAEKGGVRCGVCEGRFLKSPIPR